MICPKSTGITKEADFKGKTLGVWFFGNEYPFYAWMNKIGMPTDGGADGVTVIKQSFDVQPLIQKQADCISVMTYNELGQAFDAGFKLDDLTVFNYTEMGNDMLEDGLYVLEDKLKDKAFFDKMVRFVKASMKGWDYAREHPDEAAQIVINNDDSGGQTLAHQLYMIKEVSKLTEGSDGVLDPAAFDRTAKMVLDQKIITKQPEGAWTHDVTDAAGFK
jgi:NitT/TauT family transport system substrate-binding protein